MVRLGLIALFTLIRAFASGPAGAAGEQTVEIASKTGVHIFDFDGISDLPMSR